MTMAEQTRQNADCMDFIPNIQANQELNQQFFLIGYLSYLVELPKITVRIFDFILTESGRRVKALSSTVNPRKTDFVDIPI